MTDTEVYRAVPLVSLRASLKEVTISGDSAVAALEKARAALGDEVAFDLCRGAVTVLTYRPLQRWWLAEGHQTPE